MKLLIVGPQKRKKTEIAMVDAAKKYFEKVLYAPVTSIRIEAGCDGVVPFFKSTNLLSFDVILARIPKECRDFGYVLAKIFEENGKFLPVGYKAIVLSSSEFLMPVYLNLKDCGLKTPLTYFASSKDAVKHSLKKLSYPVTIRPPYEKNGVMKVDSRESALGIIDTMEKLNQAILIQELPNSAEAIDVLVAGNDVYALKSKVPFNLGEADKKAVLGASKAFGAQICRMSCAMQDGKLLVHGISASPKLMIFEENFGGNIIETTIRQIKEKAEEFFGRTGERL